MREGHMRTGGSKPTTDTPRPSTTPAAYKHTEAINDTGWSGGAGMSEIADIREEIDVLIERWQDAYPQSIFPVLTGPPNTRETLRAVMLARHILQSLSIDIEAIWQSREARNGRLHRET